MHACHILRFVEDLDSEYYLAQAQLYALPHNFLAKPKIFHLRRTLTYIEHQIYSNYSTRLSSAQYLLIFFILSKNMKSSAYASVSTCKSLIWNPICASSSYFNSLSIIKFRAHYYIVGFYKILISQLSSTKLCWYRF